MKNTLDSSSQVSREWESHDTGEPTAALARALELLQGGLSDGPMKAKPHPLPRQAHALGVERPGKQWAGRCSGLTGAPPLGLRGQAYLQLPHSLLGGL